jgi:AcrR family transcriptional regulator
MKVKASRRMTMAPITPHWRQRKALRNEQILAAAFDVFAAHGYAETRLDEVAKRAGVAKGTIYLYFKNKEQLFRAVARSLIQKRFDALVGTFRGTAPELLRELLSRMYSQIVRNDRARSILRLMLAESGKFPRLSEIYHREIIAPGIKAVRQVLKRGIASGEFRKTAAVEFPQILVAPGILAIVWKLLHGDRHRLDLNAYLQAHLNFVLCSVRKKQV